MFPDKYPYKGIPLKQKSENNYPSVKVAASQRYCGFNREVFAFL